MKRFFRLDHPIVRNAAWVSVGQVSSLVLQVGYFVFLARLLHTREYGIYAGAFALASVLAQFSALGSGTLFLRYVSGDTNQGRLYWGNVLLTLGIVGSLMTTVVILGGRLFLNPESARLLVPTAIGVGLCGQAVTCSSQILQALDRFRESALLNSFTNLLRFITVAILFFWTGHLSALLWSEITLVLSLIVAASAIVRVMYVVGFPVVRFDLFRSRFWEGLNYSFASSTASVYNDIDKSLLSHYGMNIANGIYTMAYRVVDIGTMPVVSIRDASMPYLFKLGKGSLRGKKPPAESLLRRSTMMGLGISAAIAFSAPLLPFFVGKDFAQSVSALRWLCLLPFFRSIHQLSGSAVTAVGKQVFRTFSQGFAATLNIGLNLWLIPRNGWLGAAWASLITDGCLAVLNLIWYYVFKRQIDMQPEPLVSVTQSS